MSERLDEVERRLASIGELHEIVGAMRALAAVRAQQAQKSLAGTRAFAEVMRHALARATEFLPGDGLLALAQGRVSPKAVIVFCAEHGFAGAFSNRVLDAVAKSERVALWIVGSRGVPLARERGLAVDWSVPMATHVGAVTSTAQRISAELYRRYAARSLGTLEIVHARYEGASRYTVRRRALLPIEPGEAGRNRSLPPLLNVPPSALAERLVDEYVFAELCHATMESFASENGARLAAMQSARRNIEEKRDELAARAREVRQEQTTTELLDVATGAEAQRTG